MSNGSSSSSSLGGATRWGGRWRATGASAVIRSHHNTEVYKKNVDREGDGDWTRIATVEADNVISAAALIDEKVLEGIQCQKEPIAL